MDIHGRNTKLYPSKRPSLNPIDLVRSNSPGRSSAGGSSSEYNSFAVSSLSVFEDNVFMPPDYSKFLEDYSKRCSSVIDKALSDWPIVARSDIAGASDNASNNATVRTGFVGDNSLRSTLWRQSFEAVSNVSKSKPNSLGAIAESSSVSESIDGNEEQPLYKEDVMDALQSIFSSLDIAKHANEWDQTFVDANVVDCGPNDLLIHRIFKASPLAKRDMLSVIHESRKEMRQLQSNYRHSAGSNASGTSNRSSASSRSSSSSNDGTGKNVPRPSLTSSNPLINDDNITSLVELQITYAYASIREDWVRQNGLVNPASITTEKDSKDQKFKRAFHRFPSCDRVTVFRHRKRVRRGKRSSSSTVSEDTFTIVVDHLMTTDAKVVFKKPKKALIKENLQEAEAMRDYVLKLCRERQDQEATEGSH